MTDVNNSTNPLTLPNTSSNPSSQFTCNHMNQLIDMYEDEIKLYLKKYKEAYAESDLNEQKAIEEVNAFHGLIKDYKASLESKLKNFKQRIACFSQLLNKLD